jgi:DHA1 family multidrug resistance protein-like MFS transporter
LFCGTVTAAATLISAGTPRERLSYALGFLSSSTFIGFSLGPLIGGVAAELLGYRMAFKIGSLLQVIGFIAVVIFVREVRHEEPQRAGARDAAPAEKVDFRVMAIILGLLFALRYARMMMPPFLPLHVQNILGTLTGASVTVGIVSSIAALTAAIAGVTLVRLGDRMDKLLLISICLGGAMIFTVPIFFTAGLFGFAVFYVLQAFATGAVEPSLQSYFSERTPAHKRGRLFGIQTLVGSMGWFVAPLTSSFVANRLSIPYVFLFTALIFGLAFIYSLVARWGINRPRRSVRRVSPAGGTGS